MPGVIVMVSSSEKRTFPHLGIALQLLCQSRCSSLQCQVGCGSLLGIHQSWAGLVGAPQAALLSEVSMGTSSINCGSSIAMCDYQSVTVVTYSHTHTHIYIYIYGCIYIYIFIFVYIFRPEPWAEPWRYPQLVISSKSQAGSENGDVENISVEITVLIGIMMIFHYEPRYFLWWLNILNYETWKKLGAVGFGTIQLWNLKYWDNFSHLHGVQQVVGTETSTPGPPRHVPQQPHRAAPLHDDWGACLANRPAKAASVAKPIIPCVYIYIYT